MKLFPAIDILDNKAVRLLFGRREQVTVYGDPVEIAKSFENEGAEFLHVVDLNGAFDHSGTNLETIKKLVSGVKIPVQLGGGIRDINTIRLRLDIGVSRVILGTALITDPRLLPDALELFGADRIVCGLDAKEGSLAVKGWIEDSKTDAYEFGKKLYSFGVKTVVFTDITRDGALTGVNCPACLKMSQTGLNVIASGGVSGINDITELKKHNIYGAILGKALYEKKLTLVEALSVAAKKF